jgi:hypothetical protein
MEDLVNPATVTLCMSFATLGVDAERDAQFPLR